VGTSKRCTATGNAAGKVETCAWQAGCKYSAQISARDTCYVSRERARLAILTVVIPIFCTLATGQNLCGTRIG
jgi:hypothetical protein